MSRCIYCNFSVDTDGTIFLPNGKINRMVDWETCLDCQLHHDEAVKETVAPLDADGDLWDQDASVCPDVDLESEYREAELLGWPDPESLVLGLPRGEDEEVD